MDADLHWGEVDMPLEKQRRWAMTLHLLCIPLGALPALIGYAALRDRGWLVGGSVTAALNFQLTLLLALIISFALTYVLVGFFVLPVLAALALLLPVLAAVATSRGEVYTYPGAIRFLR